MGSLDTIKAYEEVGLDPTKINLGFAYYAKWFMTDPSSNCGEHRIGCAVAKLESPDRTDPGKSSALTFEKSNMGTAPVNLNVSTEGTSGFAKRTKCPLNSCCSQYGNCVALDFNAVGALLCRLVSVSLPLAKHPVNEVDANGRTPLLLATEKGYLSVVWVLWNHPQINLCAQDRWRSTALHEAAKRGHLAAIKLLLARPNTDINIEDGNGAIPLWWATRRRHTRVAEQLLEEPNESQMNNHRVDIDINQGWGAYLPPLLAAINNGHSNVAMQLLALGKRLDVNTQTYHKEFALSLAARQGDLRVVDSILLGCRTDCNSVDHRGRTALFWAAYAGKRAIVERLLADDRVQSDVADDEGTTILGAAAIQNHSDIVSLLRAHRRTDDDDDSTAVQALIAAAFSGNRQTLASGSVDRTIDLWDIEAGAEYRTLKSHSGSDDHTIKLWDTTTGVELHTLQGHSDSVWSVAFLGDGQLLASGAELKPMANTLYAEGHTSNQSYSIPQLHDSASSNISPQVSVSNNWVALRGQTFLWLPPEYRIFRCSALKGANLALGYIDGRVTILGFSTL
ncbi:hypothetical protein KXV92_005967 [Aspergillus fumigatus]|nr:hypothetical protein KXW88_002292 [Aspergillus fumigatus]KAH2362980.1 hypothetical protein KXV98_004444 [Aspergillus fumigatus]KAH3185774.1 hypothetical protein KXV92_005967 [Aspergillus fumigatus]